MRDTHRIFPHEKIEFAGGGSRRRSHFHDKRSNFDYGRLQWLLVVGARISIRARHRRY